MTSTYTKERVKKLYDRYYESPKGLEKVNAAKYTSTISGLIGDPLLWVWMTNPAAATKLKNQHELAVPSTDVVDERLKIFEEDCLKGEHPLDLSFLKMKEEDKQKREFLFRNVLRKLQALSSSETEPTVEENLCSFKLNGVILDIYHDASGSWGYIGNFPHTDKKGRQIVPSKTYKFDGQSLAMKPIQIPLHIGDEVSFRLIEHGSNVAKGSVEVTRINFGLWCSQDSDVFSQYADSLLEVKHKPLQLVQKLLDWPAPWKCMLEEEQLYKSLYHQMLEVGAMCNATELKVDPRARSAFISTLIESSFVQKVVGVFSKQEMSDEIVSYLVQLLTTLVRSLNKDEAYQWAKPLKQLAAILEERNNTRAMKLLLDAVLDCCLVPPSSMKPTKECWSSIPTILTSSEFKDAVQPDAGMEASRKLPVVKHTYDSIEEYGQTYFTLLREDCYHELTNAVARMKSGKTDDQKDIYHQVQFSHLHRDNIHIVYGFRFKTVVPSASKHCLEDFALLKQGNLVCFSPQGRFEGGKDIVWGTVSKVHVKKVECELDAEKTTKTGTLFVQFCSDANELSDEKCMELLKASNNVVAVESPAFFRAYEPVLNCLKDMDIEKIHFIDDILHPSDVVKSKCTIIRDDSVVDPSHLYKKGASCSTSCSTTVKELVAQLGSAEEGDFCLDKSQRSAICQSLTHPISVIQGPPGTGKSYVAVKLTQLLLSLSTLPENKPILVMAYKNRAVDRFLRECQSFCGDESIVRIGRVSEGYENENLSSLLLDEKCKKIQERKKESYWKKLNTLYKSIEHVCDELKEKSNLDLGVIKYVLTPEWLKSLLLGQSQVTPAQNRLMEDPKAALSAILSEHTMMGREDSDVQRELVDALESAWSEWTMTKDLQLKEDSVRTKVFSSLQSSTATFTQDDDTEDDYVNLEKERLMELDVEDGTKSPQVAELSICSLPSLDDDGKCVSDGDVWDLNPEERKQLVYASLQQKYREALEKLKCYLKEYNQVKDKYELNKQIVRLKVLKRAKIIGMTTTGAAINQALLNQLGAPIVLVEEAAEVLESNLLACLTPHVKHLILIGDQNQLKPRLSCYKLAKLDNLSLFERLIENRFPYTLLMKQSRMNELFVPLFSSSYNKKGGAIESNTDIVEKFKPPPCMVSPLFWWSHKEREQVQSSGKVTNQHEVKMVLALALWILRNDKDTDIAILSPYRAQVKAISNQLEDKAHELKSSKVPCAVTQALKRLRVYTIDEFQGHEADVVIVSLVRSNEKRRIGFLKEKNRLIVGVSRQKCALYIIGDAEFLKKNSLAVWKPLVRQLEDSKHIGNQIGVVMPSSSTVTCETPQDLESKIFAYTEKDTTKCKTSISVPEKKNDPPQRTVSSPGSLSNEESNSALDGKVSEKCILLLQDSAALEKWKFIGRMLGIENQDISQLDHKYAKEGMGEMFYQMMFKWKEMKGKAATYRELISVLQSAKLQDVIESVVLKHIHNQQ